MEGDRLRLGYGMEQIRQYKELNSVAYIQINFDLRMGDCSYKSSFAQ